MKSDPKECLYCQNNETQHELMIEVAKLSVSRLFIFKEQTYFYLRYILYIVSNTLRNGI